MPTTKKQKRNSHVPRSKSLPAKKNNKLLGVGAIVLGVAVIVIAGVLIMRYSRAGIDIQPLSFLSCGNARVTSVRVEGFKPQDSWICDVQSNQEQLINLPRSLRPSEIACFWGKERYNPYANGKLIQAGASTRTVRVTAYNDVPERNVGITSCFRNMTGSDLSSITLKVNGSGIIELSSVSYGY